MTITWRSLLLVNRETYWNEPRAGSTLSVSDFLPEDDRPEGKVVAITNEAEIEAEIWRAVVERRRSIRLFDPLEHFVYALISAAALTALLLGALCGFDFARHVPSESSAAPVSVFETPATP